MKKRCGCDGCRKKLIAKRRKKPLNIGEVYCHIYNGGIKFSVVDEGFGPTIVVRTSTFGNCCSETKAYIDKDTFEKLAELFKSAADFDDYTEEYCNKAHLQHYTINGVEKEVDISDGKVAHEVENGMLPIFTKTCSKHFGKKEKSK